MTYYEALWSLFYEIKFPDGPPPFQTEIGREELDAMRSVGLTYVDDEGDWVVFTLAMASLSGRLDDAQTPDDLCLAAHYGGAQYINGSLTLGEINAELRLMFGIAIDFLRAGLGAMKPS